MDTTATQTSVPTVQRGTIVEFIEAGVRRVGTADECPDGFSRFMVTLLEGRRSRLHISEVTILC